MNDLVVTGKQEFMGKDIPVVLGGFGSDKKCVSDKTIAEIHGMEVKHVRERVAQNIKRFIESVDIVDLKQRVGQTDTLEILQSLGYAKQSVTQANHIYILSERGYAKLIKIMDTDLAWEIHDRLIDEYFELREEKSKPKSKTKRNPQLSSVNMMAKNITDIFTKAGVEPVFVAAEVKRLYKEQADIEIQIPLLTDQETMPKLYDCTEIAGELGIRSKSGKPHNQAVGDIIRKLDLDADEIKTTAFTRNGHDDVTVQYLPSVVAKVKTWLEENNYPTKIPYVDSTGNQKTRTVVYE